MECKYCGGSLAFHNGIYICENCGLQQSLSSAFESTEVFICYTENDAHGRRSRDSVIAQNIYNKLEDAGIRSFYKRISVGELSEDDTEMAATAALDKAKVVAVVATDSENFQKLTERYGEKLKTKKVIPIFSGMNVNDMPPELKSLQSINYDAIGSMEDLIKNALKLLDRERDISVISEMQHTKNRRKKFVMISSVICLIIAVLTATYIVFGTPYVLKSKKYEYAESLIQQGNNLKAIEMLKDLNGYENSSNLLKSIFDKYTGYYTTTDEKYSIYFKIYDNENSMLEVTFYDSSNGQIKFSSETAVKGNICDYYFTDTLNNQGRASVELLDSGIKVSIKTEEQNGDNHIDDCEVQFNYADKSDAPITKSIDKELLLNWLKKGASINDVKAQGYEFEYLKLIIRQYTDAAGGLYQIKNTDIQIEVGATEIMSITAPAKLIIPDAINTNVKYINKDGVLYIPYGELGLGVRPTNETGNTITDDTMVAATSKAMCENMNMDRYDDWNKVLLDMAYSYDIAKDINRRYNEDISVGFFDTSAVKGNMYLINTNIYLNSVNMSTCIFYKLNIETGAFSFVCDIPNVNDVNLSDYPEYFGEFTGGRNENQNAGKDSLYRVRKSANDSASQIGAYKILDNAKKDADAHKAEGYKVYDDNGRVVYEP